MPIDTSGLMFPKPTPKVLVRKAKQRKEAKAWRQTKKAVDARDAVDESPVCFVTGKRLQNVNGLDEWTYRDRAHLEGRAQSKARRFTPANVISTSRAVHKLFDNAVFFLLNKRGQPAKSIGSIDHFAWNRRWVAKGEEPFKVRKGLPVVELEKARV